MTRSLPSIIVLTLMCFTISYGLVQFPDAGILDAAPAPALSEDGKHIVNKQSADGTPVQLEQSSESSAPSETPALSSELFQTESSNPPTKGSDASPVGNDAADNSVNNDQDDNLNEESNDAGLNSANENGNPTDIDSNGDALESSHDETESQDPELPTPESNSVEPADNLGLDGITENDIPDDSSPIETAQNPLPNLDQSDVTVPTIIVDQVPPEPEPLLDPEPMDPEEFPMPESEPESDRPSDDSLGKELTDNSPDNAISSNNDNPQNDSNSATEKQTANASGLIDIKSDPNAQEIPPSYREKKSANSDALTQPAVESPQNYRSNENLPTTGTIPIETFPLDIDDYPQKADYTIDYQEPYDKYGFDIPATGPIVVKRLPPIENSVDPIYNNAQLDRFAL